MNDVCILFNFLLNGKKNYYFYFCKIYLLSYQSIQCSKNEVRKYQIVKMNKILIQWFDDINIDDQ